MYNITKHPTISYDYIRSKVSDYGIYSFYLGRNFKIGEVFSSPLRGDKTPSFGTFESGDGKILFKDFGNGESGNAIMFVQKYFGLPTFVDALIKVYSDLIINLPNNATIINTTQVVDKKIPKEVGVQRQDLTEVDKNYWGTFNITPAILNYYEVDSIKHLFINNSIKHTYSNDNPMYVFKVYDKLKVYRPLSDKKQKWYGSLTRNHILGYKQLPADGELLIITKSLKDVMCLHSLGFSAISPSAEGVLIPEKVIDNLKRRFKTVLVLYDNDEPGYAYAEKMTKKYGLKTIFIPKDTNSKDVSEHIITYGVDKTKELLTKLVTVTNQ